MDEEDVDDGTRRILWENVRVLMRKQYGEENLSRVAKAAGFEGGANMTRIRKQETDVSLRVLRGLSKALGVPIWQLLTPSLGAHLHVIKGAQVLPLIDLSAIPAAPPPSPTAGQDAQGGRFFKRVALPPGAQPATETTAAKAPRGGKRQGAAEPKRTAPAGRKA